MISVRVLAGLMCALAAGWAPGQSSKIGKSPAPQVTRKAAPAAKTGTAKKVTSPAAAHKQATGSKQASVKRATRRSAIRRSRPAAQQAPTRERYAEIQRALIERGYLDAPATGIWGPDSVEALRKFQQDQHLEATGKINALTLIALGLGPNRASLFAPGAGSSRKPAAEQP